MPQLEGYPHLIERFVHWAESEPDIRAAIVIGSRARENCPADEWSDLDIVVFAVHPERYVSNADWLAHVGQPCLTFVEKTPDGGMERRALFTGGLDVDFAFDSMQMAQQLKQWLWWRAHFPLVLRLLPASMTRRVRDGVAFFADVVRRGTHVLLDKDNFSKYLSLLAADAPAPTLPTQAEFLQVLNDFWYHTVWTAKKLRRGEVWMAKSCCDVYMKWLLLRVIEWHARVQNGAGYDTWHRGRFLEQWADPRAIADLRHAFAHYDQAEVRQALLATMELFHWLSLEIATRLDYSYPHSGQEYATTLVNQLLTDTQVRLSTNSLTRS